MGFADNYRKLDLVTIAASLHSEGGDWRSIYFLSRYLETKGEKVALINPAGKRGLRQFLASAFFAPRIIVNGLGTAMRWEVLLMCWLRKDVFVYLHETSYELNRTAKNTPLKFRIFSRVMGRNPILCVSRQAEALYKKRFEAQRTRVVYECPGIDVKKAELDKTKQHIVMVGSINSRKGAELFSKVADLAAEKHPNWQFHWIGGRATMNSLYQSENVVWHGWQWNTAKIVEQCDLFFLSSIDDPCPLSALEAMPLGLRLVCFRETGIAEVVEGTLGCRIFETYSAEAAFEAVEKALADNADPAVIRAVFDQHASLGAFSERISEALQQAGSHGEDSER